MLPPGYEVSPCGRVWAAEKVDGAGKRRKRRLLSPRLCQGYLTVTLLFPEGRRHVAVHRLVASQFIPNPANKPEVDHKNRDRTDNRVTNLRWATDSEQSFNRNPRSHYRGRPISRA